MPLPSALQGEQAQIRLLAEHQARQRTDRLCTLGAGLLAIVALIVLFKVM